MPQKLLADWIRLKGSAFQRKLSKYEVTIATAKWLKTPGSFLLQLQYIQDSKLAQPIRVKFVSPSRFKDDTFDQRPSFRGKYVVFVSLTRKKMPVISTYATIATCSVEISLDMVISRTKSKVFGHHRSSFNLTKWGLNLNQFKFV